MKKLKPIILSITLILVILFSVVACTPNDLENKVEYMVAYAESYEESEMPFDITYINTSIESDLIKKFDSMQELADISSEKHFPFYNEDDENYNSKLSKKIREYDDSYFRENALVLIFSFDRKYATAKIEDINVEGSVLTVTFARPDVVYETSQLNTFVYIIELNKAGAKMIDEIKVEFVSNGTIFTLQSAYDQGFLSSTDIKNIGYYHNEGRIYIDGEGYKDTDYTPMPKNPEELDSKVIEKIKRTYLDYVYSSGITLVREEDIVLDSYLGSYNDYIAIKISIKNANYLSIFTSQTIAETTFAFSNSNNIIMLWRESK